MNGNLEYYKVFYYVEKMGSITAASARLMGSLGSKAAPPSAE